MANRFERGKVPPYTLVRPITGGVKLAASFSLEQDTENIVLAGAIYPIYTRQTDASFTECASSLSPCSSGLALSRSTYSTLFNRTGVNWGSGNGVNTFNVPDLSNNARFTCGLDAGPTYSGVGTRLKYSLDRHNHAYNNPTGGGWPSSEPTNQTRNPQFPTSPNLFGGTGSDEQTPVASRLKTWIGNQDSGVELPVGTVIMSVVPNANLTTFLTNNPYLLVPSGQSIDVTIYPKWFAATGQTSLPDFRGRFLGLTDNTLIASGTLDSSAGPAIGNHYHVLPARGTSYVAPFAAQQMEYAGGNVNATAAGGPGAGGMTSAAYAIGPGNEIRPYNAAVTYLIKVA